MDFSSDQIEELKVLSPGVQCCHESGYTYFLIPNLALPEGCIPSRADALLCPMPRDGYVSRLFFPQKIVTRSSLNWNANGVRIVERNWYAFSWNVRHSNLRPAQMVAAHLRGLS